MNIAHPEKIVVLGLMSHFPVAGVAWQTIHYLVGFQRLGYDVYYVEAHGCAPSKLMRDASDDGPPRAAAYIAEMLRRFDLDHRWAYHSLYPEPRYFGMSEGQLKELYSSAALIINLHGSHVPTPELTATGRLVYVESDPVQVEMELHEKRQDTHEYLAPHCAFFTYGENLGNSDCLVPAPEQFKFLPTRQPVVLDFWKTNGGGEATTLTTIGNWRQPWREVKFKGEVYRWSKHFEFQKFLDVPRRAARQPFELALSSASCTPEDRRLLERKGWRVRDALEFSSNLDKYRRYITESRGEFTVAKDQNVRLRSGWFSDRAATYLAAGRPVITQETGFSNILPTGEGLFAFSKIDDILGAVEAINADYDRHRRAAATIARECFSHDVVLTRLLEDVGISKPNPRTRAVRTPSLTSPDLALPSTLVLAPIGRWPTRLPKETVETALALPAPVAGPSGACASQVFEGSACESRRASIVIVTHNGLLYTKLCLASLLGKGWNPNDELIIVDNASTDGTQDYLRDLARLNPLVRVVFNQSNRGFAAANNQGLAQATGEALILLNNDTIVQDGWRNALLRWLGDPGIGLVGPVTNRTCNEAQVDAPYRTYAELEQFAHEYTHKHSGESHDIRMLAMFCLAMRREVFQKIGPLDEQFEIGMFEDDDYAHRVRQAGYRIVCAEDVFVHHFGQGSIGELCADGAYDRVLASNRRRFEEKWGVTWQPHGRRQSPDYQHLRLRIRETVAMQLPAGATVLIVSKGDEELLQLEGRRGWHYPQAEDGQYANIYPAHSAEAISHLEALRAKGGNYLVIPKPAFWWLEYYADFKNHLQRWYKMALRDEETCLIFDLHRSKAH